MTCSRRSEVPWTENRVRVLLPAFTASSSPWARSATSEPCDASGSVGLRRVAEPSPPVAKLPAGVRPPSSARANARTALPSPAFVWTNTEGTNPLVAADADPAPATSGAAASSAATPTTAILR